MGREKISLYEKFAEFSTMTTLIHRFKCDHMMQSDITQKLSH